MTDNLRNYDQAYLAEGGGDFVQVTNFTIATNTNSKVKHTLRKDAAGVVRGRTDCNVSFDLIVDADGPERPFHRHAMSGREVKLRAKIPGNEVLTMVGKYNTVNVDCPLDDAVKFSVAFIGGIDRPLNA